MYDISTSEVSFGIIKGGKLEIIGNIDNSKDRIKIWDESDILIAFNGNDYWIISKNGIIEINDLNLIEIINLNRGKIVIKNGIAYKYDFENGEIKESRVNNKKATNIYELNGKFYVPKKGFTESKELDGFQDMIFLEKTGFHLKKEPPKQLHLNNILPEELEKYFDEITF